MGVIQLDQHSRIVEANDRARRLVRKGDGLFDETGSLHARLPADEARLQRLVARALPSDARRDPAFFGDLRHGADRGGLFFICQAPGEECGFVDNDRCQYRCPS